MNQIDYFKDLSSNVQQALKEDIGEGDLTADLIDDSAQTSARILCRTPAIMCGQPWVDAVFEKIDPTLQVRWLAKEGEYLDEDSVFCIIEGSAKNILTAERTALNFLQTLMATAYQTYLYTQKMEGSETKLLDTRKTLPGLRLAQKYAVHCGGGHNHRIGLYDAILIKENHIMAAGGIDNAIQTAKQLHKGITIEIETESLSELEHAVNAGADIIMLDNFNIEDIHKAVSLVNKRAKLEVSGNVEIDNLEELIKTKVDFISTGAITKHIQAIDLSMRFDDGL